MGRVINFMNGHNRLHVGREDISVLGDLETSLLNKWRSVLNEIGDKDDKLTAEDQCLMAILGMAIGHTRRLCACFINKATGIHLHRNKISHATRLELASIETWLHEEGLRAPDNPDPSNVIVKVRADGEGAETKETYHSSPVEALQIRPQTKLKSLTMRPRRRNLTSRNSIWERLAGKKIKNPTKRVPKTAKKPPNSNPYLWLTGFLCYNSLLTYFCLVNF